MGGLVHERREAWSEAARKLKLIMRVTKEGVRLMKNADRECMERDGIISVGRLLKGAHYEGFGMLIRVIKRGI